MHRQDKHYLGDFMENKIVIYQSEDGLVKIDVHLENDSVWLNQTQIAKLLETTKQNVSLHINNAINDGELEEKSVVKDFLTTANDGKKYNVKFYNLDTIISVGYRVKSIRGVQFRRWATSVLREHLVQGYTINKKRLNQLGKAIEIISRSRIPEVSGIANVLQSFTKGLDLLDNYDRQELSKPKSKSKNKGKWQLTYKEARKFIDSMKFGRESFFYGWQ
jgi:prophage antirepressor-like protein